MAPVIRRALMDAGDNVTGIQERYAQEHGFGPQYQDAKNQYMKFKRELGSGLMNDFTSAQDVEDQAMLPRVSKILNPASGEALRLLLKSSGIDSSPLADLVEEKKTVADNAESRVKDLQKQSALNIKAMGSEADQRIEDIGNTNAIIKGGSDLALAGKNTEQIRQDAIQKLVNNAKVAGITNPSAYIQIMYGTALATMGSMFGFLHIGRGLTPVGVQQMLKSKGFQDWVIQESGVETPQIPVVRKAIAGSYPKLRAIAESAIPASTLNKANQPNKVVMMGAPAAPAPAPSKAPLEIAQ